MSDNPSYRAERSSTARPSPRVVVILVNYNCGRFVPALLTSLRNQTYRDFSVHVYDNGSTDGSVELFRQMCPDCTIQELGENTGFSAANNRGIRDTESPYVLLLNVDVVLEADFLAELVPVLESDPQVGWVAPAMNLLIDGEPSHRIDRYGHHMQRNRKTGPDSTKDFVPEAYSRVEPIFGASGCAVLYKREMLESIAYEGQYLDEDFFAYYEDIDLDWRAQLAGWRCLLVPTAVGYHAGGGSGLRRKRSIAACELSNRLFMMVKNDRLKHVAADIWPVGLETAWDLARFLRHDPSVPPLAAWRFVRLLPSMLRKRRHIRRQTNVSPEYVRSLIRHPGRWDRR